MTDSILFDYAPLCRRLEANPLLAPLLDMVPRDLAASVRHGDFPRWLAALQTLPDAAPDTVDLLHQVRVGNAAGLSDDDRDALRTALMGLHPWRKGPFDLFGLQVETEWRSDWKWDRLLPHISSLQGRTVLDVGCGNGYHAWRMAGAGAALAIGVDPHLLFNLQYWAIRHYVRQPEVYVLPLALEEIPPNLQGFDTVFSMGVLYHRRSPFDHLLNLKQALRAGGELVLETLVIPGEAGMTLVPQERYARMPNVWFLPTSSTLVSWLEKIGYIDIRIVDETATSVEEQHTTDWMTFESLADALDPDRPGFTVEGYPAPVRAILLARKPW